MQPLKVHAGIIAALNRANVDTDAIMPKQYLKSIRKFGYGDWVFDDWRYLDAGDIGTDISLRRKNPEFELNQPAVDGASILLTQENFGCGSSREHAVWGLRDYGFKVILAPSFADIFFNNCFNNGLLAIELPQMIINQLFDLVASSPTLTCVVNLQDQIIECGNLSVPFVVDAGRRMKLLRGLDHIDVTLIQEPEISKFELQHKARFPWLFEDL